MKNKRNTGYCSTGYCPTGNYSTGDWSTGNYSTGDWSTGNYSTGNSSTGNSSTGYSSTGNWSTGNHSTGYSSTGYSSTGNWSTGNWSTGNHSTGNWSISNRSAGHFSTEIGSGMTIFDQPCTEKEYLNIYEATPDFCKFNITEWIEKDEMTLQEKEQNQSYQTTGGYLRVHNFHETWHKSFHELDKEEREKQIEQLESIPNFDYEKWVEISQIDYRAEKCSPDYVIVDGIRYVKEEKS